MSDKKLPPGMTMVEECGGWVVHENGDEYVAWNKDAATAAIVAWTRFPIAREKFDAMERDHRAMEALRFGDISIDYYYGTEPRVWVADDDNAPLATSEGTDLAGVILACAGHSPNAPNSNDQ